MCSPFQYVLLLPPLPSVSDSPQADDTTSQPIIFGFGATNPGSKDESATLLQHVDNGPLGSLDLTKPLNGSTPTPTPTPTGDSPLTHYQRMILAHAIICVVGFALLLPCGVLLARYLRTFSPTWYTGHWIAQFGIGPSSPWSFSPTLN